MGNQPIYRYRQNRSSGGVGILIPLLLAIGIFVWPYCVWHGCKYGGGQDLSGCGAESDWVWNARSWVACGIWWGLLAAGFAWAAVAGGRVAGGVKWRPVPPKGRLRVEATTPGQLRPPPASVAVPRCLHLDAVPVEHMLGGEPWAWLCPLPPEGCGQRLPAEHGRLARPCCGSAPGTRHVYNCPHRKENQR